MIVLLTNNIIKEGNKELSQTGKFGDEIADWMSNNAE